MSLNVTVAQLKQDITDLMKGTSLDQISDFYNTVGGAADRMNGRLDLEETRRTAPLTTPFYDNVQAYNAPADYKAMIDIRPQTAIYNNDDPEAGGFSQTTPRQFTTRMTWDSFSIKWNNGVRSLRAQRLPNGSVVTLDSFDSPTSNGSWSGSGDIDAVKGIYQELLQYIQGSASLGFNLTGVTGSATLTNTTALVQDLSANNFEDASAVFFYIPSGFSSRFTSFAFTLGEDVGDNYTVTVTTQGDGTPFTDGWNFFLLPWQNGSKTGSPTFKLCTFRKIVMTYSTGTAINGCLLDSWTDALGNIYEAEYYSECLFRDAVTGSWKYRPTLDTDILNVGPLSYEILKTEMMVDITRQIRTGAIRNQELTDLRLMLNGQPQSRYVKDPPYHGLYADYVAKFPTSAIPIVTRTYDFDV